MANSFGSSNTGTNVMTLVKGSGLGVVALLVMIAVLIVVAYIYWPSSSRCPRKLTQERDGSLTLETGQKVPDMNEFQQWWHSSGINAMCPLPVLGGPSTREVSVMDQDSWGSEQTYAKTPINKVDDYEFSRVFGYERDGHMDVPRQNWNLILEKRTFDWADKPMSSDERRGKYAGLKEGFTAAGDLKSVPLEKSAVDAAREAAARYGEKRGPAEDSDIDCKVSREAKEVAAMVAKAYESDPNFEPVVTKVGPNQWEVTELKPKRRHEGWADESVVDERVVDTDNDKVDVEFRYREKQVTDAAIDPYFTGLGDLPWTSERHQNRDPFNGPVPGMERMFGPTLDHKKWY